MPTIKIGSFRSCCQSFKSQFSPSNGLSQLSQENNNGVRIDKIAQKIWQALTLSLTVATIAAAVVVMTMSSPVAMTVLSVSAVGLAILLLMKGSLHAAPHLPEKLQMVVYYIQSIVTEAFALIAFAALYPINLSWFDPKEKIIADKQPILLVHGYMHNSSAWIYLRYRLKKMGAGPIFTINLGYPLTVNSIEDYSQKVAEKAKEIEKLTGRKDLCLIGHSMGGLVSLHYGLNKAPSGKPIDVITHLSPLQGTYLAYIGIGQCAKEMRYQSPFVQELKKAASSHSNKIRSCCHIGTKTDLIVRPTSSAFLNHLPNAENYWLNNCGHAGGLYDDRAADLMIDFYRRNQARV